MNKFDTKNEDPMGEKFGEIAGAFNLLTEKVYLKNQPPTKLYHYTTASSVLSMVQNNGIYASPSFSMNDPKELIYALEVIEKACKEIIIGNPIYKLQKDIAQALLENEYVKTKTFAEFFPHVLLISFSEAPDNLSQWRTYADDGNGYAVGISTSQIDFHQADDLLKTIGSWVFTKCVYCPDEQSKIVDNLMHDFITAIPTHANNLSVELLSNYFLAVFWEFASAFKHPSYIDEREWRVRSPILKEEIDTNQFGPFSNGKYIKASKLLSFNTRSVIDSITMGPRQNFIASEFGLDILLRKSKLPNRGNIIKIRSEAPYR